MVLGISVVDGMVLGLSVVDEIVLDLSVVGGMVLDLSNVGGMGSMPISCWWDGFYAYQLLVGWF